MFPCIVIYSLLLLFLYFLVWFAIERYLQFATCAYNKCFQWLTLQIQNDWCRPTFSRSSETLDSRFSLVVLSSPVSLFQSYRIEIICCVIHWLAVENKKFRAKFLIVCLLPALNWKQSVDAWTVINRPRWLRLTSRSFHFSSCFFEAKPQKFFGYRLTTFRL